MRRHHHPRARRLDSHRAGLIAEESDYSRLAARLLLTYLDKEVRNQGIASFSRSIAAGAAVGVISDDTAAFVSGNRRKLDDAIDTSFDRQLEFFGLSTVYDRYLLRYPEARTVTEAPQYFLMRVACGLATDPDEAISLYRHMAAFDYLPSSPTLFNAGTTHSQLSSCYLLDSPGDELGRSTAPTATSPSSPSMPAGSAWRSTKVRARGVHHLNLANWVSDLFMRRAGERLDVVAVRSQGGPRAVRPARRRV